MMANKTEKLEKQVASNYKDANKTANAELRGRPLADGPA